MKKYVIIQRLKEIGFLILLRLKSMSSEDRMLITFIAWQAICFIGYAAIGFLVFRLIKFI